MMTGIHPSATAWKARIPQPVPEGQKQKIELNVACEGRGGGAKKQEGFVKKNKNWYTREGLGLNRRGGMATAWKVHIPQPVPEGQRQKMELNVAYREKTNLNTIRARVYCSRVLEALHCRGRAGNGMSHRVSPIELNVAYEGEGGGG